MKPMARTKKEPKQAQQAAPEAAAPEDIVEIPEITVEKEKEPAPVIVDPEAAIVIPAASTKEIESWTPKTEIGKKVKAGQLTDLKQIFEQGGRVQESQIIDALMPGAETDLLLVGQAKGKFGGGQRRVFKQTQKKTMEGNKPKFSAYAVVGNRNGFVGLGKGKAKETVPAREKAFRNARLNIRMIRRGCGSWQCNCRQPHSVPYTVVGSCGSVRVKLIPAPKGKGLIAEKECQKILRLAGIKDVWTKTFGNVGTKANLILACMDALEQLMKTKTLPVHIETLGIVDGPAGATGVYETPAEPAVVE